MNKDSWISDFVTQVAVPLLQNCKSQKHENSGLICDNENLSLIFGSTHRQYCNLRPMKGYREGLGELVAYLNSDTDYWRQELSQIGFLKSMAKTEKEFYHYLLCDQGERKGILTAKVDYRQTGWENIHSLIKSTVKSLKSQLDHGNRVFLLGRDVWFWVPICVKMDVPFYFDSRVSRIVAGSSTNPTAALRDLLQDSEIKDGDIVFDTGFAGSIYKATVSASGKELKNLMLSAISKEDQIYPNLGLARPIVLSVEYLTKPFKTGRIAPGGGISQSLASKEDIFTWILTTIGFWHLESPKVLVNRHGMRRTSVYHSTSFNQTFY